MAAALGPIVSIGHFPDLFKLDETQLASIWRGVTLNGRYQLRHADKRDGEWHELHDGSSFQGVKNWHNDCGSTSTWCFVWADRVPTEIKAVDGSTFQGQPCELVAFNNHVLQHRHPSMPRQQRNQRNFVIVRMRNGWRLTQRRADFLRNAITEALS